MAQAGSMGLGVMGIKFRKWLNKAVGCGILET